MLKTGATSGKGKHIDYNKINFSTERSLVRSLTKLYSSQNSKEATNFLNDKCTKKDRRALATLAGLESDWINCDQRIEENVKDLSESIRQEIFEPYCFFRTSLTKHEPRAMFMKKKVSTPLKETTLQGKRKGNISSETYWQARDEQKVVPWLPKPDETFDTCVHFIQGGSGTGIHIGSGNILTCAHVLDSRQDDIVREQEGDNFVPERLGRKRVVMFPSGRMFFTTCIATEENASGTRDVAVMKIGDEIILDSRGKRKRTENDTSKGALPSGHIAMSPATNGTSLFCIGNPSNIDLESGNHDDIEFNPPAWHTSVGECQGYRSERTQSLLDAQDCLGRAPTRGEKKALADARMEDKETDAETGLSLLHSCWTYWGHSGGPIFNSQGKLCGLHSSWDERNGLRVSQKLDIIETCLEKAFEYENK